jgi:hypothetical protein
MEPTMNALTEILNRKDAERDQFYCPCCKDRFDADEMDLANGWDHSLAMRAKFGAACCISCTDDRVLTADGVLVPRDDAVVGYDYLWSTQDAFDDAKWRGRV